MGIHTSYLIDTPEDVLDSVVLVDLDNGKVKIPSPIPSHAKSLADKINLRLKDLVQLNLSSVNDNSIDTYLEREIRATFLEFFVKTLKNYTSHITFLRSYPKPLAAFNKSSYLRGFTSDVEMRFANDFICTQSFSHFLDCQDHSKGIFDELIEIQEIFSDNLSKFNSFQKQIIHGRRTNNRIEVRIQTTAFPSRYYDEEGHLTAGSFQYNGVIPRLQPSLIYPSVSLAVYDEYSQHPSFTRIVFDSSLYLNSPKRSLLIEYQNSSKFKCNFIQDKNSTLVDFLERRVSEIVYSFPINATNLEILSEVIKLDNGRLLFAELILLYFEKNKSSGSPEHLKKSAFDFLTDLTWKILNQAHANFDYVSTGVIMKLSCIYCYIAPDTRNTTYLYEMIRKHQIWSSSSYWEGAFFAEVAKQRSQSKDFPPSLLPSDPSLVSLDWSNLSEDQRKEGLAYEEDLLFSILTSFIDYMIKFGKSVNAVRGFIGSLGDFSEISFEHSRVLMRLIDNLDQARRLSETFEPSNNNYTSVRFLFHFYLFIDI